MTAAAGALARSTGIEIRTLAMAASTSITTGQTVAGDANGRAVLATTSVGDQAKGLYIAIETVDNSSGSAGDKTIRVAGGNTYVYATAGGAIKPGEAVKADSASKCAAAATIFAAEVVLGRYIGHENEEAVATNAAANDVIIVRLGL